eukprot:PhM_4_TR14421/c0_g1_i1/m.24312
MLSIQNVDVHTVKVSAFYHDTNNTIRDTVQYRLERERLPGLWQPPGHDVFVVDSERGVINSVFTNLIEGSRNSFRLVASNDAGASWHPVLVTSVRCAIEVPGVVRHVTLDRVRTTSLRLSWLDPATPAVTSDVVYNAVVAYGEHRNELVDPATRPIVHRDVTRYHVACVRLCDEDLEHQMQYGDTPERLRIPSDEDITIVSTPEIAFSGLVPGSTYAVRIACGDAFRLRGHWSDVYTFQTTPALPGAVRVDVDTATARWNFMRLFWSRACLNGADNVSYSVYASRRTGEEKNGEDKDEGVVYSCEGITSTVCAIQDDSAAEPVTHTVLTPWTSYVAYVVATTSAGSGPRARPVAFTTPGLRLASLEAYVHKDRDVVGCRWLLEDTRVGSWTHVKEWIVVCSNKDSPACKYGYKRIPADANGDRHSPLSYEVPMTRSGINVVFAVYVVAASDSREHHMGDVDLRNSVSAPSKPNRARYDVATKRLALPPLSTVDDGGAPIHTVTVRLRRLTGDDTDTRTLPSLGVVEAMADGGIALEPHTRVERAGPWEPERAHKWAAQIRFHNDVGVGSWSDTTALVI